MFDALAHPVRAALLDLGIQTPTQPQAMAIPHILRGKNVLLVSPTASGKTEATLLPVLSRFITNKTRKGIAILYVTPLRALNRDLFKRETQLTAKIAVRCDIRHGDTSASQRRKQSKDPPEMLITTPETLQPILPSKAMRRHLRSVQAAVIDEIVVNRARRAADLVLSYGRQATIALLTWGVGPQTAASILAKMHVRDEDFCADLLKAKLRYIQTRPFWD